MIYLDNSATSYPKPRCVVENLNSIIANYGANPGRGLYPMADITTEKIFLTRNKVAKFFNMSKIQNVIFTYNCTTALNMAIKGIAKENDHFIISNLEHNAVLRPLEALKKYKNCDYSIAEIECDDYLTIKNFEKLINRNTVAIICTGASNVFGIIPPYKEIAALAHKHNLLFILDYSQLAGVMPIDLRNKNIDIVCCSGHKGLYGLTGVGLLLINNDFLIETIIEGGTGSSSLESYQPIEYPDRFESGTPNTLGIISLSDSIDFLKKFKSNYIYNHETDMLKYLQLSLKNNKNIKFYTSIYDIKIRYAPILSLNIKNMNSDMVAQLLSNDGIAVRSGLHCSPLAHKYFNTLKTGTVRVSPSIFTKKSDMDLLINSLIKIAK